MQPLHRIHHLLFKAYGAQGWWPLISCAGKKGFDAHGYRPANYGFPATNAQKWEVAVGAVLAQSTSWKNAEKALIALKNAGALSHKTITKMPTTKLAALIKSSGYHNQKAKKLKALAQSFALDSPSSISRESLLENWGVGKETADSILLYAYNKPVFVVDAYTKRVFSRIGLCSESATYDEVQQLFHTNLPKEAALFNEYHALIVKHAKAHCRKIPECEGCPLKTRCKYGQKNC